MPWVDARPQNIFHQEVNALGEYRSPNPPNEAIQALARCLYPAIRSYFESEEGQREFAEWQSRRGIEPAGEGGADAA